MTQDFSTPGFVDMAIRRALIAAKTNRRRFETMEAALKRELACEGLAICDMRLLPDGSSPNPQSDEECA